MARRIALWLPARSGCRPVGHEAGRPAQGTPAMARPRVLLVDDDANVRDVLAASLEDAGYRRASVESGAAALAWLEGRRTRRHPYLGPDDAGDGRTDIDLTAQELRTKLPAVLLTGYAGDGATLAVGRALSGPFSLLRKPVVGTQLLDRISALLLARQ